MDSAVRRKTENFKLRPFDSCRGVVLKSMRKELAATCKVVGWVSLGG